MRFLAFPLALLLSASTFGQTPAKRVDFNRDVRPLLSDRCFKCHGFDAKARKASLRLDTLDGMTRMRRGRRPVVAGNAEHSELVRRITSKDPKVVMPPPSSGLTLSEDERALLRRWIDEGATFERHWAYVSPKAHTVPPRHAPAHNEVDDFVLAKLASRGLTLSPEASRETLIRRATLDLTGLPPTPEEVDAFVSDTRPNAYERVLERLFASPRFGERLALEWLDAARYADTNGFHHDNVRTSWPYRDWVIDAFNDNMPFDRFVTEQLAGDLLENPTQAQRVATAFGRMHNINDEGGALDAEYRVEAVCDRIETVATTFMGLTMTCARCHDHKYDPLTQEDYYSLYAFFNSIDERGVYRNNFEQARAYPARLLFRNPELLKRTNAAQAKLDAATAELRAAEPAIERERLAWERRLKERRSLRWIDAKLVASKSASGVELEHLEDGSIRAKKGVDRDTFTFEYETEASSIRLVRFEALTDRKFGRKSLGHGKNGNVVVSHIAVQAISRRDAKRRRNVAFEWAWADHEQPNGDYEVHNVLRADKRAWALEGHNRREPRTALLLADRPFGFEGGTRLRVTVACESRHTKHVVGRARLTFAAGKPKREDFPMVAGDWFLAGPFRAKDFDTAYAKRFGPENEDRLRPAQKFGKVKWVHKPQFEDGKSQKLNGERAAFYLGRRVFTPVARELALALGSDDAIRVFVNGEQVHANKALRGVKPDSDKVTIGLQPGENVILLKIVNSGGPAGFYYAATAVGATPSRLAPAAFMPPEARDGKLQERYAREWGRAQSPTFARLDANVRGLESARAKLDAEAVPVLVMEENDKPTETFVLSRGRYDLADKKRPVDRRPPTLFGGTLPADAPRTRLGFARWLTRDDHPLTSRVRVNRLWQMLFGIGIVETSENFGQQAAWPSHLELLDWLARHFVSSGWDQKALLRLIMTSATYRQRAVADTRARKLDPRNRLLAWFPRRRLPAESIRDQALYVAGLLVERVGGASVRPYQPKGLWREVSIGGSSNTQVFRADQGDGLYRRSLYTFWKRTSPSPQMRTFDAPTREVCIVQRNSTNTPLQALVLWNDVQFIEAARALAARTLREATTERLRIVRMFRRCTSRHPGARELAVLQRTLRGFERRYAAAPKDARALIALGASKPALGMRLAPAELAAWTMLANTLLSLDETIVRD